MAHEESETIEAGRGWRNIYGRNTPRAGMPIPKQYGFEKTWYPNLQEAEGSAIVRSSLAELEENKTPYQRLMEDAHRGHNHVKK